MNGSKHWITKKEQSKGTNVLARNARVLFYDVAFCFCFFFSLFSFPSSVSPIFRYTHTPRSVSCIRRYRYETIDTANERMGKWERITFEKLLTSCSSLRSIEPSTTCFDMCLLFLVATAPTSSFLVSVGVVQVVDVAHAVSVFLLCFCRSAVFIGVLLTANNSSFARQPPLCLSLGVFMLLDVFMFVKFRLRGRRTVGAQMFLPSFARREERGKNTLFGNAPTKLSPTVETQRNINLLHFLRYSSSPFFLYLENSTG